MSADEPGLLVACFCAAWCGTCREYAPLFDEAASRAQPTPRIAWIDIEDDPDVLGELDVENFPTLLIARGDDVLFFGPVTPHAQTLARLVRSAGLGQMKPTADAALAGLPRRVRESAGW